MRAALAALLVAGAAAAFGLFSLPGKVVALVVVVLVLLGRV